MKKVFVIAIAAVLAVALLIPSLAVAAPEGIPDAERLYKFNIIGVDNVKDVDMTSDNGKRMFVLLEGTTKILLQQAMEEDGETPMAYDAPGAFDIIDANGTDGEATFQMPAPGYEPYIVGTTDDVWSDYSIYIRSLGKPGGWTTITTCAELVDSTFGGLLSASLVKAINNEKRGLSPDIYASVEQVGQEITERPKGKSSFTNVTAQLTSIVFSVWYDIDNDGEVDEGEMIFVRVPIFDDSIQGEYWEYDNNGLKLLQVWIYDIGTNVTDGDDELEHPEV
ncbi:hypothetical protein ACFLXA_01835 [Chloroflexota bacterium]